MYEATDLPLRQRPLQPDVPCLLWQVGTVESSLFGRAANKPGRFTKIRDYLLRFYPGLTLYIPPVEWRPVADDDLLKQLVSAEHRHLGIDGQAARTAGTGASLEGQVTAEQAL